MVKKIQIKTESAIEGFITNIDEMKTGMRTIKMSRQEDTEIERIESSALEIKKQTFRLQRTHALTPPVIDLSSAFVYMLVIGGGGYMALSDQFDMDGASIITFLIGLVLVFDPARHVSQFFTQLQSSLILQFTLVGNWLHPQTNIVATFMVFFPKPLITGSRDSPLAVLTSIFVFIERTPRNGDVVLERDKNILQVPDTRRGIAIDTDFRVMPVVHAEVLTGE